MLWLTIFFVVPLGFLAYQSLQSGNVDFGYAFTWAWGNYWCCAHATTARSSSGRSSTPEWRPSSHSW